MFILGGTDADDNFSRRCLLFSKYLKFFEKPPMLTKRAYFPSVFCISNSSIYVIGGSDGLNDLALVEKFSIPENNWKVVESMEIPRSGASALIFENLIFVFGGNNQLDGI